MGLQRISRGDFYAILRSDLLAFVHRCFQQVNPGETFSQEWYLEAIVRMLEQVRRGEIKRLIINLPPRSLKSIIASVAFPAFVLGHDPRLKLICASYSSDLAMKHAADCRAVITSDWYRGMFPDMRIGSKDTQAELTTAARGGRLTTSVGGTLTGRGGDIVIIDDPMKAQDAHSEAERSKVNQWITGTVLSRLNDKRTGAIIVVMQRVHMDDLTGHLLREGGEDWTLLSLPAIAEAEEDIPLLRGRVYRRKVGEALSLREPVTVLEALKRDMGSDVFQAQYQQDPVPPGGVMIKREWLQYYDALPADRHLWQTVQSWDTAAKGGPQNDWSVCTTWLWSLQDARWYLTDVWRGRVDYPTPKAKVISHAEAHQATQVLVEEASTAIGLCQELKYKVRGLTPVKPDLDKRFRLSVASAKIQAGQVLFPQRAPWLSDFLTELLSFPNGRHDDQVDSLSQILVHHKDQLATWRGLIAKVG